MIGQDSAVLVRTVRIARRDCGPGPPSGIGGALGTADLRPRGLPASAILCLRRVRAPRPWSADREGRDVRKKLEWERSARGELEAAVERAARPAQGGVPAGAAAVLFADRAELLACLASDWCDGSLAVRWWWRALFPGADLGRLPQRAWFEAPEHAPAALARLTSSGRAASFVARIPPAAARALLSAVLRRHGLERLERALEGGATARPSPAAAARAPWRAWAPAPSSAGLAPEQAALLGVLLTLRSRPGLVRSRSFAEAARRWASAAASDRASPWPPAATQPREATAPPPLAPARPTVQPRASPDGRPATEPRDRAGSPVARRRPAPAGAPSRPGGRAYAPDALPPPRRKVPGQPAPADPVLPASQPSDRVVERPDPASRDATAAGPAEVVAPQPRASVGRGGSAAEPGRRARRPKAGGAVAGSAPASAARAAGPARSAPRRPASREEVVWPEVHDTAGWPGEPPEREIVETAFGGLFYLLNVGLSLGLYGDFTQPLRKGIDLPIWDFLALLGERLAGPRLRRDPLLPLLARLAGRRADEPPGRRFRPPAAWRLPPDWLKSFPEPGVWRWSADAERLRVRHPAGFLILDLPVALADPGAQLRRALRRYAPPGGLSLRPARRHLPGPPAGAGRLAGWLAWLLPYLRARLRRALGCDARQLRALLLRHRARIVLMPTELEVVLSLGNLPIDVRLAGLDRDPGWVPSAGRFISFRFE